MEKINVKDLNLLVASREIKLPDNKWLYDAIELLINQRVSHCYKALNIAITNDEAFMQNHCDSQIIIYKSKQCGRIYGHFSVPVYNNMIEYLNNSDAPALYINKGIVQQALRQYFYDIRYRDTDCLEKLLDEYQKDFKHLEDALTEIMLIIA